MTTTCAGCSAQLDESPHFIFIDRGSAPVCALCCVGLVGALLRAANAEILELEQALSASAAASDTEGGTK